MPGDKTKLWKLVEHQRAVQNAAKAAANAAKQKHEETIEVQKVLSSQTDTQPPNVSGVEGVSSS
jgi:hypothetical protein